jgi:hypothetical protein
MITPTPNPGWLTCRYHIAEKSPTEQPARQRRVLIPALFHTYAEPQKVIADADSTVGTLEPCPSLERFESRMAE